MLPSGFWDTWDSYVQWALDLGLPGLGILSFTEAVIQPIPPEALTFPMFLDAQGDPLTIFLIWAIVTMTSVSGALVGWWLGRILGRGVAERYIREIHVQRLDSLIMRYGSAGIFVAAVSPIPYKVLAWVAGMVKTYVSEKSLWIADNGIQVLGGHGFIREHPVEMWFRHVRTLGVLEGAVGL